MIKLSNTIEELIDTDLLNFFYTVSIKSQMHYVSTPFDIQLEDGVTYLASGGLLGIEPPRISSVVDRATYKVSFADPDQTLKSYFETGATGDDVIVRIGFFNTLGRTVENVTEGSYFPQLHNTIVVYKGVIDSQNFAIDFAQESVIATIECSSPMADLDLVRSFFTNRESMRVRNPNDSAFDENFNGSEAITLKWGKY